MDKYKMNLVQFIEMLHMPIFKQVVENFELINRLIVNLPLNIDKIQNESLQLYEQNKDKLKEFLNVLNAIMDGSQDHKLNRQEIQFIRELQIKIGKIQKLYELINNDRQKNNL